MKPTIKRWALIFTFAALLLSPVELALLAQQHRPVTSAPTKSTQPVVDNTTQPSTTKSQSDEASDPVKLTVAYIAAGASIIAALIALGSALLSAKYAKQNQEGLARLTSDLTRKNQEELARLTGELTRVNQEKLAQFTAELDRKNKENLAQLNHELDQKKEEVTARREYEYEARKRLYQECEPLIFQFVELSENALYRIYSLARSARHGDLPSWLCESDYYIASTMYNLLAPTVIYKLIQRRLTIVDLALDRNIDRHYQLAKHLAWSFTADFEFAWGLEVFRLPYDPNHKDWEILREKEEATYWRQGLPIGRFDTAVESLIIRDPDPDGHQRLMSFGEFETELHKPGSTVYGTFAIVRDMITCFHPQKRPVAWRMLITQAHIYESIVRFHKDNQSNGELVVVPIPEEDRKPFYWRREPNHTEQQQLDEPFSLAEAYLQKWVGKLFRNN